MASVEAMMEVVKRMLNSLEPERKEREAITRKEESRESKAVTSEREETASSVDTFADGSPAEA